MDEKVVEIENVEFSHEELLKNAKKLLEKYVQSTLTRENAEKFLKYCKQSSKIHMVERTPVVYMYANGLGERNGEENVKVTIKVYDIKVKAPRGRSDDIIYQGKYKGSDKIREQITRGTIIVDTHVQNLNDVDDEKNDDDDGRHYYNMWNGFNKFGGITSKDDGDEKDAQQHSEITGHYSTQYFKGSIEDAGLIIRCKKENGKAAHLGAYKINIGNNIEKILLMGGSKNYHYIFRNLKDLSSYNESYSLEACKTSLSLLDKLTNENYKYFLDTLSRTGLVCNFEMLMPKDQHIEYAKLEESVHMGLTLTLRRFENLEMCKKYGKCLPVHLCQAWFKSVGIAISKPTFTKYSLKNLKALEIAINKDESRNEGSVIYIMDNAGKTLGLWKVKTDFYVIWRAIREKLTRLLYSPKFAGAVQQRFESKKKSMLGLKTMLKLTDEEVLKYRIMANRLCDFVQSKIAEGELLQINIRNQYSVLLHEFLESKSNGSDIVGASLADVEKELLYTRYPNLVIFVSLPGEENKKAFLAAAKKLHCVKTWQGDVSRAIQYIRSNMQNTAVWICSPAVLGNLNKLKCGWPKNTKGHIIVHDFEEGNIGKCLDEIKDQVAQAKKDGKKKVNLDWSFYKASKGCIKGLAVDYHALKKQLQNLIKQKKMIDFEQLKKYNDLLTGKERAVKDRKITRLAVVFVGRYIACGKSTIIKNLIAKYGGCKISQDDFGGNRFRTNDAFVNVISQKEEIKLVYVDRGNFNRKQREFWLQQATAYGLGVVFVHLDASKKICTKRAQERKEHPNVDPKDHNLINKIQKQREEQWEPINMDEQLISHACLSIDNENFDSKQHQDDVKELEEFLAPFKGPTHTFKVVEKKGEKKQRIPLLTSIDILEPAGLPAKEAALVSGLSINELKEAALEYGQKAIDALEEKDFLPTTAEEHFLKRANKKMHCTVTFGGHRPSKAYKTYCKDMRESKQFGKNIVVEISGLLVSQNVLGWVITEEKAIDEVALDENKKQPHLSVRLSEEKFGSKKKEEDKDGFKAKKGKKKKKQSNKSKKVQPVQTGMDLKDYVNHTKVEKTYDIELGKVIYKDVNGHKMLKLELKKPIKIMGMFCDW